MKHGAYPIGFTDDPDVGNLSKIKALLYYYLEVESNPRLIGRLYLNQSQIYQKIKNYPLANEALEKAAEYFIGLPDQLNLASTYYYQGLLLFEQGKQSQSLVKWNQALHLLSEERDEEHLLKCQISYQIGNYFFEVERYEEARKYLKQGVLMAEKGGYLSEEVVALQGLANTYMSMGNLKKALKLYYQVLAKWRYLNDEYQIGVVLNKLGQIYYQMNDFDKATNVLEHSLKILKEYESKDLTITLIQLAEIYVKVEIEKAKLYCKEAIDLLLKDQNFRFNEDKEKQLAGVFYVMGLCCRERAERKNMFLFFHESMKIYKKYQMKAEWQRIYKIFYKYLHPDEELRFDQTKDLVEKLTRQDKFNLNKFISQII